MAMPRFQIGELLKIFFWVILIAVPIGLYYYYYTGVQTRYDNQRNFRALNEVSSQFEVHLKALKKLFLFVPVDVYIDPKLCKKNPDPQSDKFYKICKNNALKTYKRRLETNNFFKDLDVKDVSINQLIEICKDTKNTGFKLNSASTQPSLSVYPCRFIKDNISQCLFKEEKSRIACLKQHNNKEKRNEIARERNKNLLECLLDSKNKAALKKCLSLKTLYFELPLSSLLGSNLPLEFNEILISNNSGKVLYQKGFELLDWTEKKTFLRAGRRGNNISNINWLLEEATDQIDNQSNADDQEESPTGDEKNRDDFSSATNLEHSTFIDLEIAGIGYRVYIHRFTIPYNISNLDNGENVLKDGDIDSNDKKIPPNDLKPDNLDFNKLYALGIVEKDRLGGSVLSMPFIFFAFSLLILLLGFLSWPFLKLKFMGTAEAISANDIQILLLSLLFSLVVVSIFLLTIITYYGIVGHLDEKAKTIALGIQKGVSADLNGALNELLDKKISVYQETKPDKKNNKNFFSSPENECITFDWKKFDDNSAFKDIFSCKENKTPPARTFPIVRDVFALNSTGRQFGPIIYYAEQLYSSTPLWVGFRDYFKNPRDGKTWHWKMNNNKYPDQPFYMQRINNFADGNKSSQISIPFKLPENSISNIGKDSPVVLASTSYLPSIAAPVLPASFNFAIIENASGDIFYHSEDGKSFIENLYAESDHNKHLIAHAQMKHKGIAQGFYHGKATQFYILPFGKLPWSIVVYYDMSRLHVFMVKTAIVTFFSYLLYLIPVLFLLLLFTKFVIKNWNWLWPHHLKSSKYSELTFILVFFSLSYFIYVITISGWTLYISMIFAVPFVLLGIVWLFIGNNVSSNKYFHLVFWISCSFLLFSLIPMFKATQEDQRILYFYESVIALFIIMLAKYFFFKEHNENKKDQNSNCPEKCRNKYLGFITLIYICSAVAPSIGLFKETFTVNQSNYIRINQLHFANQLQKQSTILEKYARMFYPGHFDKPINSHNQSERFSFEQNNDKDLSQSGLIFKKGIYGFGKSKISTNIGLASKTPGTQDNNDNENTTQFFGIDDSPAFVFLNYLQKINLHFSQQHVVKSDTLNQNGWHFGPGQSLFFTTEDSFGVFHHKISTGLYSLWLVLSEQVTWKITLSLGIIGLLWSSILSYFSRRVFGIYIPEPIENRNPFHDKKLDVTKNPFHLLIRGKSDNFSDLLNKNNFPFKQDTEIQFLDMLSTNFYKLQKEDILNKIKVFVVDNLDASVQDKNKPKQMLTFLEMLVRYQPQHQYFIFIRCEISPLYRLTNPQAYPFIRTTDKSRYPAPNIEEVYRWSKLLSQFKKHYFWTPVHNDKSEDLSGSYFNEDEKMLIKRIRRECIVWPELAGIEKDLEDIIKKEKVVKLNEQQILEYIRTHGNVFYRRRWELCTRDERLCLYQLASDYFVNPTNIDVIEHLYRRGYIIRAPYFKVANETFKRFINTAELLENPNDWEFEASQSVWASMKIPLFIILFCLTGLLLYVASDTLDVTLGLLSGLLAFIPLMLRGVNILKGSPGSGGGGDIDIMDVSSE